MWRTRSAFGLEEAKVAPPTMSTLPSGRSVWVVPIPMLRRGVGEFAADHPEPLVLGGEPLPRQPGVPCSSCNARKGLSQRRR